VSSLKIEIPSNNMRGKPTNTPIIHLVYELCMVAPTCFGITLPKHNTPIHNILPKALRTLPEDGNVMPKRVGATVHN
jgi:hypothetical protein